MRLYIPSHLLDIAKSESQTGESRGGDYAARVRVGTEKDGSPKYKYFKTKADYKAYIASKRDGDDNDDSSEDGKDEDPRDLKSKLKGEQKTSKLKTVAAHRKQERALFTKK